MSHLAMKPSHKQPNLAKQQGVVLVISLIVLVAMGLAGIAMVRQLGAGLGVAGNLAFKQSATSVGDIGLEAGGRWIQTVASPAVLANDNAAQGYFSSWTPAFNPVTYDWTNANSVLVSNASYTSGERIRYVIHRLCRDANTSSADTPCVVYTDDSSQGGELFSAGVTDFGDKTTPFYRITARVQGARNTVSYVQQTIY